MILTTTIKQTYILFMEIEELMIVFYWIKWDEMQKQTKK